MNKEKKAEYMKVWRKANRAKCNIHNRRYRLKKFGIIIPKKKLTEQEKKERKLLARKKYYTKNKEKIRIRRRPYQKKYMKKYFKKAKMKVFHYYSGHPAKCARCGFKDVRALQLDHIAGGGVKHIKKIKMNHYAWVIKNKFPNNYQILCANCNWIKRFENNEVRKDENETKINS